MIEAAQVREARLALSARLLTGPLGEFEKEVYDLASFVFRDLHALEYDIENTGHAQRLEESFAAFEARYQADVVT